MENFQGLNKLWARHIIPVNVILDTSHNISGHVRNLGKAINIPPSTFVFTF